MESSESGFVRRRAEPLEVENQVPLMKFLMERPDSRAEPQPAFKLVIDIDDFITTTWVAVMPYKDMADGDAVEAYFEAFVTEDQPIGRSPEMKKTLESGDVGFPVVFELRRDSFLLPENLLNYYARFYFTVKPKDGELRKSITQTVQVKIADPYADRLSTPVLQNVGKIIYPEEQVDGVEVTADAYAGMDVNDIVVLFDSEGGVADWLFVEKSGDAMAFRLSQDWLKEHLDAGHKKLTLQMHYGRANRGLRSRPFPVEIASKRAFDDAPRVTTPITFFEARAGLPVTIPEGADIGGGTTIMHIAGSDNIPVLSTTVFAEVDGDTVFNFAPKALDVILGNEDSQVYFTHETAEGDRLVSPKAALKISLPGATDRNFMPRLQCLEAQGIDRLNMAKVDTHVNLELGGWPLMAAGQKVRIFAFPSPSPEPLVEHVVTNAEVEVKKLTVKVEKQRIPRPNVQFKTKLYFNVDNLENADGEQSRGVSELEPLDLPVVE